MSGIWHGEISQFSAAQMKNYPLKFTDFIRIDFITHTKGVAQLLIFTSQPLIYKNIKTR